MVGQFPIYAWDTRPTGIAWTDGVAGGPGVLTVDYDQTNCTTLGSSGWTQLGSGASTTNIHCEAVWDGEVEQAGIVANEGGHWEVLSNGATYCRVNQGQNLKWIKIVHGGAYGWPVSNNGCLTEYNWNVVWPVSTPVDQMRNIITSRHAPAFRPNTRRSIMPVPRDVREQRARETLRRVIGDDKFKNFLRTGFVSVRAKSGMVYQIFPSHGITCVYNNGVQIERLCVVLQGDFAPTDSLIMRYILILNNEKYFRSFANVHSIVNGEEARTYQPDQRSLVEIFNELKGKKVA